MNDAARDTVTTGGPLLGLDARLYPLLALIMVLLVTDMMSRLSSGSEPVEESVAGTNENLTPLGNRRMQRGEWLAINEYLKSFSAEREATPQESAGTIEMTPDEVRRAAELARLEAEAREDQLFGRAGFVLLAVFRGDADFAILNVLDKETRERRMVEVRVGERVNGYIIDVIHNLGLEAVSPQGKRTTRVLFERQPEMLESG